MYKFPITYFEDNLIFNDSSKECWAAFKMKGFNYDYRSFDSKIEQLNSLSRFLANIGEEAMILIVPVKQDVGKHYRNLKKNLNKEDVLYKFASAHIVGTELYLNDKLKSSGNANEYVTYVFTKIVIRDNLLKSAKEIFDHMLKAPIQSIEEYFGVEYKDILEADIKIFESQVNEYYSKQNRRIAIEKCSTMETEWLIKRPFFRGLGDFPLRNGSNADEAWTPFVENVIKFGEKCIRAQKREVLTLTESVVDTTKGRTLMVHHGDGRTSYQAFLPISNIPDLRFPDNNEWLLALQDYKVQTEVAIHITTTDYKESLKKVTNKKKEIDGQKLHIAESDDEIPENLQDSAEFARMLESEIRSTKLPITNISITFGFAGDNEEELESSIGLIKEIYEDANFMLERPISDQMKLFMEFFPGSPRYVTDYIHKLPPRTFAGSMFGATRQLGDNSGPYIGTTGAKVKGTKQLMKNIYLDISRACRMNRSASGGFFGTLGGGKSFCANLLTYLTVIYGGRALILDPKGERTNWVKDIPELEGQMNVITLSAEEEDRGKLDPFIIYRNDLNEAGYLALSIITELFKLNPKDDEYLVIQEAIEWVKGEPDPCMEKVAWKLGNFDKDDSFRLVAEGMGRRIKHLRNMSIAALLFGTGKEKALDFDKKLNILQIQNLAMPKPNTPKDEYTMEELLSTVLMLPIASFARKFMHMDRRYFKQVLCDEAWALEASSAGKKMMGSLVREGRALYAGCFFIGQTTRDMKTEGIKENITYKFCFRATEINEVRNVLEFLGLEATDDNIKEVQNLENGECLFQDLDGRVGKLKVDAVYNHLIEKAFNTNPDKVQKEGEGEAS